MVNERLVVQPRTCQTRCPGELVCFIIITFYFSSLNTIFRCYMTTTTEISDIRGYVKRAVSGEQLRTRRLTCPGQLVNLLLLLLSIFHY